MIELFTNIQFEHVPRLHNKHADALANPASKAEIKDDVAEIHVIRNTLRATATSFVPDHTIDEKDWRAPVIESLTRPSSSTDVNELKDFTIIGRQLYYEAVEEFSLEPFRKTKQRHNLNEFMT